jgi:transposase
MMGERLVMQDSLFYEFRVEDHVLSDHLLRRIDRFVDCSELRQHVAGFYSATGRPSLDPELMIRMLLISYCLGIRSEWRLCEEVHLNLAYRWFCRLGLEGKVPDHSTFSKNRHGRFRESDLKERCCPNTPARRITRSIYEHAREVARSLRGTAAFERSRQVRKRIEMLFAHLKRILKMGRLRLRGPCGAQDEFLLAATAQNLRKLAKLVTSLGPQMT